MKTIAYAVLSAALLMPSISFANSSDEQMERITVTYRTPIEYAVYQYTTETLQAFNQQIRMEIQLQARMTNMQMAKSHGIISDTVTTALKPAKEVLTSKRVKSAE
ncbi:hypothetical protein [Shewanella pealeana]|uniref:Uncharacterized protein n=1 Tax=Shewanella pealeana (strain ATCC 700345 / ANG-SQ1) TaxID=398579 RepID=A8H7B5_SHEPA|nr:hypothetical protein [Shewanella pealeana]ABV88452.1 hypothetical protein Spea_3136 [Shewanella pealeana ATCC 700345]